MAEIIKNGDIEKAKVSFTCPACGTEFFVFPERRYISEINSLIECGVVVATGYKFEIECPFCGLPIIEQKTF